MFQNNRLLKIDEKLDEILRRIDEQHQESAEIRRKMEKIEQRQEEIENKMENLSSVLDLVIKEMDEHDRQTTAQLESQKQWIDQMRGQVVDGLAIKLDELSRKLSSELEVTNEEIRMLLLNSVMEQIK